MRLYHPADGNEYTTTSDDEHHLAVFFDAGWEPAPEPEAIPGHEPEPVKYGPVTNVVDTPPKSGAGSGRDAWAAHAESLGVAVTDDMTRDEIIEAVEESTD